MHGGGMVTLIGRHLRRLCWFVAVIMFQVASKIRAGVPITPSILKNPKGLSVVFAIHLLRMATFSF
jgi:hypothetical protein